MTKEQKYTDALQQLGVYNPAFDPVIHQLCKLEREEGRADKAWRATAAEGKAPLATDPAYDALQRIRRDILQHWDALGLTPKAFKRLQRQAQAAAEAGIQTASPAMSTLLDSLRATAAANAALEAPADLPALPVSGEDTDG